jgi:hypothetical protein
VFSDFRGDVYSVLTELQTGVISVKRLLLEQKRNSDSPRNISSNSMASPPSQGDHNRLLSSPNNNDFNGSQQLLNTSIEDSFSTPELPASPSATQPRLNPEQQTLATAFFNKQNQDSKTVDLSTVFYGWYMHAWHTFSFPARSKEKALHVQVHKTVAHLKRFLPDNCTIQAKPPTHMTEELERWNKILRRLANHVQVCICNDTMLLVGIYIQTY